MPRTTNPTEKLLRETAAKRILVLDGAMGTEIQALKLDEAGYRGERFADWKQDVRGNNDLLNLSAPERVREIHTAYFRAGADIVETNTFGANRIKLGSFGLAERLYAINEQGAKIARHAAREQAYVAGAIGPLGVRVEPWGKTGVDEAEA
jgi:5-methyltetrahydrofolate--homocysteine methyltransferase